MSTVIKGGHLIEPTAGISAPMDVLVQGDRIARIGEGLEGDKTIDAAGCVGSPGLGAIHVH
ncbi:MAG: dihydropyrimidinase, partial [Candidatus Hydrogenedentes bacterium]|nr:dihydropyrimidinase [Candidatus Hydrogenedentota bacterium]